MRLLNYIVMKNKIIILLDKFKASIPNLYDKIRYYMIIIGACSALLIVSSSFIPAILVKIATFGSIIGTIGSSLSHLIKTKQQNNK